MKNQREIYEALLAGETLISDNDGKLRLNDAGSLINAKTGESYSWISGHPDIWQIHKEPKWYENIPDGGVLCWQKNGVSIIYNKSAVALYAVNGRVVPDATPLTKQEIQVFLSNSPEDL